MLFRSKFPDAYNEVIRRDLLSRSSRLPKDMPRATSTGTVFFRGQQNDFDDALKNFTQGRQVMGLAPSLLKMFSHLIVNKEPSQPPAAPNATPEEET